MALGTAALVALAAASGNFEMPVVAGDAKAGLSADRTTAVLAEQPARGRSRFAVVDAEKGRIKRVLALRGDFGFDALSPDGSKVYVIHYLSRDHRHYAVQSMKASDPEAVLRTVVEKGEPGEQMSGLPISRTTSPDGWIYTLYDGAGHEPFIHALQSAEGFTVCIDLDALEGRSDLASLTLGMGPDAVTVKDAKSTPLLRVATESFEVTEPAPPAKATATPRVTTTPNEQDSPRYGLYTVLALATLAGLAGLTTAFRSSRRNRPAKIERQGI
jgi:DNA-binding beta-propeller fold protein YncE